MCGAELSQLPDGVQRVNTIFEVSPSELQLLAQAFVADVSL
jgi:hypothetical protein